MSTKNEVREKLEEIAQGLGRYSSDPMTHAENTIDDMKELAREALVLLESEQGEPHAYEGIYSCGHNILTYRPTRPRALPGYCPRDDCGGGLQRVVSLFLGTPTESTGGDDASTA